MVGVEPSLGSIPFDAIYEILLRIDNKPDLDNLCLAFPCIEELVAKHTHITNRLYWKEIKNDFLMPLALLNSTLNKSEEAMQLLRSLAPSKESDDQPESDKTDTGHVDSTVQKAQTAMLKSLTPRTILNMRTTHIQIEKLAYIFMKNQLESHHPPPKTYRSPTADERTRIIMAVYRSYIMVIMRFVNHSDFPISNSTYTVNLEIVETMIPRVQQDVYHILWNQWKYWDIKELGVVLVKLWYELPMAVFKEAIGRDPDADADLLNILRQRVRCRERSRQIKAEWLEDLVSFIFSMRGWNPGKHAEFLENLGHRRRSADWLIDTARNRDCLYPFILWEETQNCQIVNVALRTHLYFITALKIRCLETGEISKETYTRPGQTWYCRPPSRRLIKGATGIVAVPRVEDSTLTRAPRTWISPNQESVCAMIEDCLWDDWRLEEWGYHFPEFVGDGL